MFNYVKPRVYKCAEFFGTQIERPWVAMHAIGTASFYTWREAMDYALCPLLQINGYRTTGLYA